MTALDFGPLVLGGNTFGWTSDREESFAVLDAFVAAGGRAIDTSSSYSAWKPGNSGGESERILGEWIESRRPEVLISTKVGSWAEQPGLAPANIRAAVEGSLRRLHVERIDLFFAHVDDETVPQESYVEAFGDLVAEGKVRELGASNFAPARLRSAVEIARAAGVAPFTVSQDHYNLVHRDAEAELLPAITELGLVELPFWSLAAGFLTGKYRPGVEVDSARAAGVARYVGDPAALAVLDAVEELAAEHGVAPAAVALAWLRQQPAVAAPIASARVTAQLPALVQSFDLELSAEELARLG